MCVGGRSGGGGGEQGTPWPGERWQARPVSNNDIISAGLAGDGTLPARSQGRVRFCMHKLAGAISDRLIASTVKPLSSQCDGGHGWVVPSTSMLSRS